MTFLQRFRPVAVLGASIMATGVFLLTAMPADIDLVDVAALAAIAGLGMGSLFSTITVATQNTLPPPQLGAGFATVLYLGQIGGTLGVAIVGTVVNHSFVDHVSRQVPATTISRLASAGIRLSADPHILFSPTYRATLLRDAARKAMAHIPPGPHRHQMASAATRHELHLIDQLFESLRISLASAIQQGLVTDLLFAVAAVLAALFVVDIKRPSSPGDEGVTDTP